MKRSREWQLYAVLLGLAVLVGGLFIYFTRRHQPAPADKGDPAASARAENWFPDLDPDKPLPAVDDMPLPEAILLLAAALEKEHPGRYELSEQIARRDDVEVDSLMKLFQPRDKGGLGVGPPDSGVGSIGIQEFLTQIAEATEVTAAQRKLAGRVGWVTAALAMVAQNLNPAVRSPNDRPSSEREAHTALFPKRAYFVFRESRSFAEAFAGENEYDVRAGAAKILETCKQCHDGYHGRTLTRREVLRGLHEEENVKLLATISALGTIARDMPHKYTEAEPLLIELLVRPDPEIRNRSELALDRLGNNGKSSVPHFNTILRALPIQERYILARRLQTVSLDASNIDQVLITLLDDERLVMPALIMLGEYDARSAVPAVRKLLDHKDKKVQEAAGQTLARLGGLTRVPELIEALNSEDPIVRGRASITLGKLGKPALSPLRTFIREAKNRNARCSALYALGAMGKKAGPAVPDLVALCKGDDRLLQLTALQALRKIDPDQARQFEADR